MFTADGEAANAYGNLHVFLFSVCFLCYFARLHYSCSVLFYTVCYTILVTTQHMRDVQRLDVRLCENALPY